MGQYFVIINQTKKQLLNPHDFGEGYKFMEFAMGSDGILLALALLLRKSDEGGGGDFDEYDHPLVGSWVGDEIAIVGDYDESELYEKAQAEYENISASLVNLIEMDPYVRNLRLAREV